MPTSPKLACPNCGEPLIPPRGRGRFDHDGNIVWHLDDCRCRWCLWLWEDDQEPVTCACGATARVEVDDETAVHAVQVRR